MTKGTRRLIGLALVVGGAWYALRSVVRDSAPVSNLPPLAPVACGMRCGVQRWPIKTLSDPSRELVDLRPVRATIAELGALPRPESFPQNERIAPEEFTVYEVDAYLLAWDNEADRDIHLMLADPEDPRFRMIAEIPDPMCSGVCNSGLGGQFAEARAALETILAEPNPDDLPVEVTVIGVGFFDRNHGQIGAAPNFMELHPVLELRHR